MKKFTKRKWLLFVAGIILLMCIMSVLSKTYGFPTQSQAKNRVEEFANIVNYHYDEPERVYDYLCEEFRVTISKDKFVEAFIKERSYPYLTPFFINFEGIEMDSGNKSGIATFSQAARLPGMVYHIPFVYENGNYYMIMEEYAGFPDGSYLEKFENIPSYLRNGWEDN